ncbi:MAG TPA: sugar phosphate isomerase/epimerase [Anaerolineaceae bacterium]|jgi:sugar phosphate isomerase/epimerase
MTRPVTLFTGQWADLPFEDLCAQAKSFGYDGLELACWGDHFDVAKALSDDTYVRNRWDTLSRYGLKCYAISNHLVGQAVCDRIDDRHKGIVPERVWGDGKEDGVRRRAAEEMKNTARAAAKFGVKVVPGFTGSSIWPYLYSFPANPPELIPNGYRFFAEMWNPILDVFDEVGVKFALEAHPTEIAFDIVTAEMTLQAIGNRKAFGFNFDPSHLGYQGVDYVGFIRRFGERIYHVHMKDAYWSEHPTQAGVFGGHLNFGDSRRFWDFRSLGHGSVKFEEIIRALNEVGYEGPLSVEWEDSGMDRVHGATEAAAYVRRIDFAPSKLAFDAAFERK